VLLVVVAGVVGCSRDDSPSDDSKPDASAVAARAIDAFGERYAGSVSQPDVVQLPASFDIDAIRAELQMDVVLVRSTDSTQAHWRLNSIQDLGDYWVVEMASIDGPDFFSGPLYFVVGDSGDVVRVEAEDVGETITTSVS